MLHKIYAFLLVFGLFFQTTALAASTPTDDVKPGELTPELKQNALELLSSIERETGQFNVPENRIRIGIIVADLMWQHDEAGARAVSQNVFVELQDLFGQINPPEGKVLKNSERSEHFYKRERLAKLRQDYILSLAAHDPQAALNALAALKTKLFEDYDPLNTEHLEKQLATAVAKKDPEKSYALAKKQLADEGIGRQFVEMLEELHAKNPQLAVNLGKDALAKIKSSKIIVPSGEVYPTNPAATKTNSAAQPKQPQISYLEVGYFIAAASKMNRFAASDKEKKMLPLFDDNEMREMLDLIVQAYSTAPNPPMYLISQIMPEIKQYAPAQVSQIRLRFDAKQRREFDSVIEGIIYHRVDFDDKSTEELVKDAERAAPEVRDQRYVKAINKALEDDEPEKAQAIAAHIKDRKYYNFLFEQIEAALPLAKARRGDTAEVRHMLAALSTNQERIAILTELASALGAKGDKETAKALLDESLQMIPAPIKKQSDLESVAKIAAGYSAVAPEQAFTLVENSVGQMSEYINSGILLSEFYNFGGIESGELLYDSINQQSLLHSPNSIISLKNLAHTDFERTLNLANQFGRPEIRLHVRLLIAQALLDAEAVEKEKKMREKVQSEDEFH